jgi:hypothetical protein
MPEYLQNIPKFYRNQIASDLTNAFVVLDSTSWKTPQIMSIENFGEKIKIIIGDNYLQQLSVEQSLVIQKYNNQESEPAIPPAPNVKIQKTFMANDENYLYIWIESSKKWKRIPLSDWNK